MDQHDSSSSVNGRGMPSAPTMTEDVLDRYLADRASVGERMAVERVLATSPDLAEWIVCLRETQAREDGGATSNLVRGRALLGARVGFVPKSKGVRDGVQLTSLVDIPSNDHQSTLPGVSPIRPPVESPYRGIGWSLSHTRGRVQAFATALSVLVVAALATVLVVRRSNTHFTMKQYSTQIAQRATITLADGTTVTLAPGSTLRFVQDATSGRRDVYLDGEAYFNTAHDPAHPFVVFAGNTSTQVLGTAFGVRRYSDDRDARIFVTEGRVAVSGAGVLVPGDVAEMNAVGTVSVRHHADVDAYGAWTTGRLTFARESFRDVIPRLERWYGITIRVTDPALNDVPLTAVFHDQSVANLVGVLANALEARVDEHGQLLTLSSR